MPVIVGKQHAQITAAARERCRRLRAHLAHQQTLQYTQMVCMQCAVCGAAAFVHDISAEISAADTAATQGGRPDPGALKRRCTARAAHLTLCSPTRSTVSGILDNTLLVWIRTEVRVGKAVHAASVSKFTHLGAGAAA